MIATIAVTLLSSVIIFAAVLWVLMRVKTPMYRLQKENVISFLELVVSGQATESDWSVFTSISIRNNEELEAIRLRCLELEETEYIGHTGKERADYLLTRKGIAELEELLNTLKIEQ